MNVLFVLILICLIKFSSCEKKYDKVLIYVGTIKDKENVKNFQKIGKEMKEKGMEVKYIFSGINENEEYTLIDNIEDIKKNEEFKQSNKLFQYIPKIVKLDSELRKEIKLFIQIISDFKPNLILMSSSKNDFKFSFAFTVNLIKIPFISFIEEIEYSKINEILIPFYLKKLFTLYDYEYILPYDNTPKRTFFIDYQNIYDELLKNSLKIYNSKSVEVKNEEKNFFKFNWEEKNCEELIKYINDYEFKYHYNNTKVLEKRIDDVHLFVFTNYRKDDKQILQSFLYLIIFLVLLFSILTIQILFKKSKKEKKD